MRIVRRMRRDVHALLLLLLLFVVAAASRVAEREVVHKMDAMVAVERGALEKLVFFFLALRRASGRLLL